MPHPACMGCSRRRREGERSVQFLSLCIMDREPRRLTETERELLERQDLQDRVQGL